MASERDSAPGTGTPSDRPEPPEAPGPPEPPPPELGQSAVGKLARGELEHPEVKPLDLSGISTIIVGTAAWAVAFGGLWLLRDRLEREGDSWWLWVPVAGAGLGIFGLFYCRRRWNKIRHRHEPPETRVGAVAPDAD